MASACVNRVSISPETLLDCPQKYSSYSWFTHRLSITSDEPPKHITKNPNLADVADSDPVKKGVDPKEDEDTKEFDGFEFRLDDPVIMLPADELFSDGKLVPMRMSVATSTETQSEVVVRCSEDIDFPRKSFVPDPYVFSPRAPRCSSRWKELLGFKKLYNNNSNNNNNNNNNNNISNTKGDNNSKRISISSSNGNGTGTGTGATRSFRQFLNRSSKPTNDSPINLPLLKDPDNESSSLSSVSSRPSLSSSSSGHELEDLPRMSLDSDKPRSININLKLNKNTNPNTNTRPKSRMLKTKTKTKTQSTEQQQRPISTRVGRTSIRRSSEYLPTVAGSGNRGLSVDSPRMNSSGKIVFHSLERSSSSPSSLIGGPRFKHRGMERSYSANVRITPVLNVPVCSLSKTGSMFGFPIFSSQQNNVGINRGQRVNGSGNNR